MTPESAPTSTHAVQAIFQRYLKQVFIVEPQALGDLFGCAVIHVAGQVLRLDLAHRRAGELAATVAQLVILPTPNEAVWRPIGRGRWTPAGELDDGNVVSEDEHDALEEAIEAMIAARAQHLDVTSEDVLASIEGPPDVQPSRSMTEKTGETEAKGT